MLDIGEAAAVAAKRKAEMGVGQPGQQRDHAAGDERHRHGVAGLRDGEAEHGENTAADHTTDTDGGDLGQIQLALADVHCVTASFSLPCHTTRGDCAHAAT